MPTYGEIEKGYFKIKFVKQKQKKNETSKPHINNPQQHPTHKSG